MTQDQSGMLADVDAAGGVTLLLDLSRNFNPVCALESKNTKKQNKHKAKPKQTKSWHKTGADDVDAASFTSAETWTPYVHSVKDTNTPIQQNILHKTSKVQ